MAERYATKTGNWSDVTVWDGGATLPQAGDVVRPNSFSVTIDQDITVAELRRDASSPAVAGGNFQVSSGARTVNAIISAATFVTSDVVLTVNGNVVPNGSSCVIHRGSGLVTVNGSVTGGSAANQVGVVFEALENGSLVINGNVIGGTNFTSANGVSVLNAVSGSPAGRTVAINGNVTASGGRGLIFNGQARVVIAGSVYGSATEGIVQAGTVDSAGDYSMEIFGNVMASQLNAAGQGYSLQTALATQVTIHGSVAGRAGIGLSMSSASANATVEINGGVTGGSAASIYGVQNQSVSPVTIQGESVGGSHATAHGVSNESTGTIRIGGQSITNPSGALGLNNSGGGTIETGYLVVAYFPQVTAGEGGKVLVTLLKNSVNASELVTGTPTVDVFDFARDSVFAGAQNLTLDDGVYSYQHPTNVITRGKLYYARITATIDGVAQDLAERSFIGT